MVLESFRIGREMLKDISRYLNQKNSMDGVIRKFELVMQSTSDGGRSGEGAFASANCCF